MPQDERLVSEKVLGSSNPVSRFGRSVSSSVSGIFFGIVLIIASFGLMWWGEQQPEHSKTVATLPLVHEAAVTHTGLIKLQAQPAVTQVLIEPKTNTPVLYYHYLKQEFKKVKEIKSETRTVQQNGQDVQQTFEHEVYVDTWVDLVSDKKWASFRLSNLNITPTNATLYVDLKKMFEQEQPVVGAVQPPATATPDMYPATKMREIVVGIPAATELLIVGEAVTGSITGGTPFIISDKSNDALIAEMKTNESRIYWGLKFATWLLMTIGFVMLFGPISVVLNILPGLGKAFNGILFLVLGVLSAIIVALGTIMIRYWWAVLLAIIVLIVVAVSKSRNKTAA